MKRDRIVCEGGLCCSLGMAHTGPVDRKFFRGQEKKRTSKVTDGIRKPWKAGDKGKQ